MLRRRADRNSRRPRDRTPLTVRKGEPRPKRFGNNPKRRIAPQHSISQQELQRFEDEVRYLGSAHHKRIPADYGFHGPPSPRPHKSLCDSKRVIRRDEAKALLLCGLRLGMVSTYRMNGYPKYVWSVDQDGEPYEAKLGHDGRSYHGYRLGVDDRAMREEVIREWLARNRTP